MDLPNKEVSMARWRKQVMTWSIHRNDPLGGIMYDVTERRTSGDRGATPQRERRVATIAWNSVEY